MAMASLALSHLRITNMNEKSFLKNPTLTIPSIP